MDFIDQLRGLSSRIANTKNMIQTEEATKNAMVMPFIQILGYNVFDPLEVTPELISDIGTKKGEKSRLRNSSRRKADYSFWMQKSW